ncbi:UNVERIFIED_CONTAM: Retrovirus-related Pol polyprotein from transposon TNT 1-94 [Sesamum calycinum]|uniref:Retrovirus-related Pol polyprotein from transposon TNT 1-94 n=1 Tax=Sesamum calycinum TaxID=2727403 RepID=A0AAW2RUN4_9LAMI
MAMTGAKFEVVKFDGTRIFRLWQTRVKDLLAQQGFRKRCGHRNQPQWMMKIGKNSSSGRKELYIITNLARLDVSIEDEDKAMILLCSLPFSYEHLMTTLTYGKKAIKVDEIIVALLAHNQRKQNAGEKALTVIVYMSRADEKHDDSSKSVNVVHNDNSDCSDGDMLSVSTNQYVDAWILDFECPYHITPNMEWFSSYGSGNSDSVYLGDDRCCNIVGVGEVRIKMYAGTVRTLSDVRHISDLKKNLISLSTLHKNGFIPKADENRKTIGIVKCALTLMKGKITVGKIYKLLGNTDVGGVHSVDSYDNNTKLWYMRLERMNRSLTERARCLRLNAGLPKNFWAEAVSMACYLINRSPRVSLDGKVAKDV